MAERLDEALLRLDLLRDRPLVSATLAVVAVGLLLGGWWLRTSTPDQPVEAGIPFVAEAEPSVPSSVPIEPTSPLVVHVAGAVARPGIVVLDPGSRIVDAIEAAGGASADADLHRLNLAAPISDGMQIRVPVPGEAVPINGTGSAPDGSTSAPLAVNAASAAELEALHGIGPALAKAIVDWRTEHGPFTELDDLLAVPGIGPAKLAGLADLVTF